MAAAGAWLAFRPGSPVLAIPFGVAAGAEIAVTVPLIGVEGSARNVFRQYWCRFPHAVIVVVLGGLRAFSHGA